MLTEQYIEPLVQFCRTVGNSIHQVQAAGGNISIKLNSDKMLIKSSGFKFKDMKKDAGWTLMNYSHLPNLFVSLSQKNIHRVECEAEYANLIGEAKERFNLRPSMEAGFHSVIPNKYVVHLHSISGIVLGFFQEELIKQYLLDCFSGKIESYRIPQALPGYELTRIIQQLQPAPTEVPQIFVLSNHGVIWSGPDFGTLTKYIQRFESFFNDKFETSQYNYGHSLGCDMCSKRGFLKDLNVSTGYSEIICLCGWPSYNFDFRATFPDFAMYFDFWSGSPDLVKLADYAYRIEASTSKNLEDKKEVFLAQAAVCSIGIKYRNIRFLADRTVIDIKKLETERLRFLQIKA